MTEIISIVKDVGFPIFVAVWFIVKDSKEKQKTREVLQELSNMIKIMSEKK